MSTFRKLKRQQAKNKAQRLSSNGKHGKSSKLFKMVWRGQQEIEKRTAREKKQDEQLKKLLEEAKENAKENNV